MFCISENVKRNKQKKNEKKENRDNVESLVFSKSKRAVVAQLLCSYFSSFIHNVNYLWRSFFRWLFILTAPVLLMPRIMLSMADGDGAICGIVTGWSPFAALFSPTTILIWMQPFSKYLFPLYSQRFCFEFTIISLFVMNLYVWHVRDRSVKKWKKTKKKLNKSEYNDFGYA